MESIGLSAVDDLSSACSQIPVLEADNFMDFSDAVPLPGAAVACISRPHLSADRQTVYEDTSRNGHVLGEMYRLYLTGRLCDVDLCVDSERIPCHRLVMAASSVYFERMFSNDMTESRSPKVIHSMYLLCADNIVMCAYRIVSYRHCGRRLLPLCRHLYA